MRVKSVNSLVQEHVSAAQDLCMEDIFICAYFVMFYSATDIQSYHIFLFQILEEFNLISRKEQPFGREISGIVTNGILLVNSLPNDLIALYDEIQVSSQADWF